jgi:cardiolipin synthase
MGRVERFTLRDLLTPPNLVTLARIVLVPVVLVLLASGRRVDAVVVILAMMLSDGIDGYIARKTGRVTEIGKILDPIADKIAIDSILLFLAIRGEFPMPALVVLVARDVAGLVGVVAVGRKAASVPAANTAGKIGFVVLSAMVLVYVLNIEPLELPLAIAGVGLAVASGVIYAVEGRRAIAAGRRGDG